MQVKTYVVTYKRSKEIGCRSEGARPIYDFLKEIDSVTETVHVDAGSKAVAKLLAPQMATLFYMGRAPWYLIGEVQRDVAQNITRVDEVSAHE